MTSAVRKREGPRRSASRQACIVCGGGRGRPLLTYPRELVECSGCGFVYAQPRPTRAELSAHYSAGRNLPPTNGGGGRGCWCAAAVARAMADEEDYHRLRLALARERLRRLAFLAPFSAPGTVLDVGCGRGEFLHVLSGRFPQLSLLGVEPSTAEAEYARERYRLDVRVGMFEGIDSLPKVDIVSMFHVLEHVHDPARTLGRVASLLNPGGLLVLEVPNMKLSRVDLPLGRRLLSPGFYNPEHLWHFTPRSLGALLVKQGYRVEAMTTYTFALHPLLDRVAFRAAGPWLSGYLLAARLLTAPLAVVDGGLGLIAVARVQGS